MQGVLDSTDPPLSTSLAPQSSLWPYLLLPAAHELVWKLGLIERPDSSVSVVGDLSLSNYGCWLLPACTWLMEGLGMGRGKVGCVGAVEVEEAVDEQTGRWWFVDQALCHCPGPICLQEESGRGVEVVAVAVGAPGQKMVYNDSHFPALSSLATAACTVCQRWDGMGGWRDVGYDRNLDSMLLLFLFRGLAWWPPSLSPESQPYLFFPCHVARVEAV